MPIDPRIALGVQPLQVQFRDPIASYNQLAQLQSNDTQNQLAQMQMQEARQLAPYRMQEQQYRAASNKLTYDQAKQAQDFVTGVMSKAAEHPEAPQDPMDAAMQMLQHPNPQVQAIGGHLLDATQKLMAFRQQAQFLKDESGSPVAPTPAGAPAAVASGLVDNVDAPMVTPGTLAPVGFNTSARLIQPEGKSYANMSNTERIQFDVARIQNSQLGQPQAVYTLDGKEVPFREYVNANIANSTFKPDNALAAAVAPDVAAAPAVNAMISTVASALQNADSLKKEIEKGDRTYGSAPGWKSKRELLVEAYKQALKPGRADTTFGAINPSEYTPESVKAFLVSKNYGDLVAKTGKSDKLIGNVNPSDFTPTSLAVFNLSGKYEDLVLKPAKAEKADKLIGNVNPSDYTPESVKAFSLSSDYGDLVLKPSKADKADRTIANVNPDSYTPASVAAFALSNNYADLVLRPEKAKDSKNIANINPNDFTPASIEKFVVSGKYSDLVRIPDKVGAGGEKPVTGTIQVIDPTDPTGKRIILVTQAQAVKDKLIPASSTKEGGATEGERKAATLLQRLQFSQSQLTDALVADPNAAKPGLFASAVAKLSTPLANTLTPEARQRVQAAQLDILDAALTLGTGAAYTKEQLEGYRESYFPQIGDKPNQISDKQKRLDNVISAAKIAAGRAAQLVPAAPAPAAAASSAMSAADAIINKGRR